jgi:hypothetical protein
VAWQDLIGRGIEHTASPLESARFALTVGRVTVRQDETSDEADRLAAVLAQAPEDLLVVRYPADRVRLGAVLAAGDRDVLPAGALTYWAVAATDVIAPDGPVDDELDAPHIVAAPDWPGGPASVREVVGAVVEATFTGYGNHYLADPLLDAGAALAGYREWATGTVETTPQDVLLLVAGERPIGVATCRRASDGGHLEVLLAGMLPKDQGRGRYGYLLAGCARHAERAGLGRLVISTQVHNVRVQRAWARAGLRPFAAVETAHAVRRGLLRG